MHTLWLLVVIGIINQDVLSAVRHRPSQPAVKVPCEVCIYCLTHPNNTDIKIPKQRTSIDRGVCPKSDTEEFYKLQQIEFLYRRYNKKAPCVKYCGPCRKAIINTCRKFQRLKKSGWDTMYDGIFIKKPISVINNGINLGSKSKGKSYSSSYSSRGRGSDSSEIKSDNSKEKERPSKKLSLLRSSQGCCEITTSIVPYMGVIQEAGVTWYAVWFRKPLLSYQLAQEAQCSSYCSLVKTTRTFLFTTVQPHPFYGHTYMLFSYYMSNIKFFSDYIGGYCKKQNP